MSFALILYKKVFSLICKTMTGSLPGHPCKCLSVLGWCSNAPHPPIEHHSLGNSLLVLCTRQFLSVKASTLKAFYW